MNCNVCTPTPNVHVHTPLSVLLTEYTYYLLVALKSGTETVGNKQTRYTMCGCYAKASEEVLSIWKNLKHYILNVAEKTTTGVDHRFRQRRPPHAWMTRF